MPGLSRPFAAMIAADLAILCICTGAPASPTETVLTMDTAVRLAVSHHPELKAAVRDSEAARSGLRSARALVIPEIVFTPGLTRHGSDEEVLVRQPLELNGARSARTGIARARLDQMDARASATVRNLVLDTRTAYVGLSLARAQETLARELLAAAEESDRLTRRQVEVGTRPGIDQVQTGIEVVRAQQQVTRAESETAAAASALNTLIGRPANAPMEAVTPLISLGALVQPATVTVEQAVAQSADMAFAEAERREQRQQARLARAEGKPDLAPQFRAGTITRGIHETGIGIGITLPLLDWGSRKNRVREAEQAADAQTLRLESVRRQVERDVTQALTLYQAAETIVNSYETGVLDQARRLQEASRSGVQAGQTSVLTLLDAQRTFRAVQREFNLALADRVLAAAALEYAAGTSPEPSILQSLANMTEESHEIHG